MSSFTVLDESGTPCADAGTAAYNAVIGAGGTQQEANAARWGAFESCCESLYGSSCLQPDAPSLDPGQN